METKTKRSRGRPPLRWMDDIRRFADENWYQMALDREYWGKLGMDDLWLRKKKK